MNDPMWDLAALFLESEFTPQEEEAFLSHYESDQTPVSREKIAIYKFYKIPFGVYGQSIRKSKAQILVIMV